MSKRGKEHKQRREIRKVVCSLGGHAYYWGGVECVNCGKLFDPFPDAHARQMPSFDFMEKILERMGPHEIIRWSDSDYKIVEDTLWRDDSEPDK